LALAMARGKLWIMPGLSFITNSLFAVGDCVLDPVAVI
jgi:hypothetical protein